jgi:anti-sigma factor RsiW
MLTCPAARALASDYVDGDLDPATAAQLEDHLTGCGTCPPLVAALIGVLAELRALPEVAPRADWLARTTTALRTGTAPTREQEPS